MNKLIENDTRSAVAYLNFKNEVNPDPYRNVGPSRLDEFWWPVSISEDKRRVGYSLLPPQTNGRS